MGFISKRTKLYYRTKIQIHKLKHKIHEGNSQFQDKEQLKLFVAVSQSDDLAPPPTVLFIGAAMLHFCHYLCAAPARTPAGHDRHHAILHFLRGPSAPALTANGFTATDRPVSSLLLVH